MIKDGYRCDPVLLYDIVFMMFSDQTHYAIRKPRLAQKITRNLTMSFEYGHLSSFLSFNIAFQIHLVG